MISDTERFTKLCAKIVGELTRDWREVRKHSFGQFETAELRRDAERILIAAEAVCAAARASIEANKPDAPVPNEYHTHNHYGPKPGDPHPALVLGDHPRTFR